MEIKLFLNTLNFPNMDKIESVGDRVDSKIYNFTRDYKGK